LSSLLTRSWDWFYSRHKVQIVPSPGSRTFCINQPPFFSRLSSQTFLLMSPPLTGLDPLLFKVFFFFFNGVLVEIPRCRWCNLFPFPAGLLAAVLFFSVPPPPSRHSGSIVLVEPEAFDFSLFLSHNNLHLRLMSHTEGLPFFRGVDLPFETIRPASFFLLLSLTILAPTLRSLVVPPLLPKTHSPGKSPRDFLSLRGYFFNRFFRTPHSLRGNSVFCFFLAEVLNPVLCPPYFPNQLRLAPSFFASRSCPSCGTNWITSPPAFPLPFLPKSPPPLVSLSGDFFIFAILAEMFHFFLLPEEPLYHPSAL